MNGFEVSNTGYFLFANAQKERDRFEDRLTFEKVLMYPNAVKYPIQQALEKNLKRPQHF